MAFSPAALRDLFRRDQPKDPFGGDDMYDGESRFAGKGPKIALAASGLLFVTLIGGVAAIVLTQEGDVAPPVMGSLADLEIVDDIAPTAPAEAAPAAPAVVADSTAATDRSVERRPWLAATPAAPPAAAPPRPGLTAAAPKPAAPAAAAPAPAPAAKPAAVAAVTPPAPAVKPTAPPAAAKPAEVKTAAAPAPQAAPPPPSKVATMAPPAATAPAATPANLQPKPISLPPAGATPTGGAATSAATTAPAAPTPAAAEPAEEEFDPSRDIAGIPALGAADKAPGAPRRFDAPAGDSGPAIAGGRPRLVEPPLPPTDKIAVSAPPPRYANLTDVKGDAGTAAGATNTTKIAFIVEGLGLNQTATDAAINKLPAAVTLAFSPYTRNLKSWLEKAKAKGHEVLIEVPMESKQFPAKDPGPLGLLTSVDAKDNQERLDAILKDAGGAVGVLDVMGSKFRESSDHINPVFAKLKQSNLFYVQGEPGVRTGEATVPTAIADLIIDERPFRAAIDARLDYAERLAKYQGSVVVSMSAKPVSFERVVLWLEQAQKKGVVLAPISQVLIK
jgi:polysaccharide deacetylase 2 family uncharacterized protein YibQ